LKEEVLELIQKSCRGVYQKGLIKGKYKLDGSDLQGKAKEWKRRYLQSKVNLLIRINNKLEKYYQDIKIRQMDKKLFLFYKDFPCIQL